MQDAEKVKSKQISNEYDWTMNMIEKVALQNKSLIDKNKEIKIKYNDQEKEKEFLLKQIVFIKKQNNSIKLQLEEFLDNVENNYCSSETSRISSDKNMNSSLPQSIKLSNSNLNKNRPQSAI